MGWVEEFPLAQPVNWKARGCYPDFVIIETYHGGVLTFLNILYIYNTAGCRLGRPSPSLRADKEGFLSGAARSQYHGRYTVRTAVTQVQ